MHSRRRCVSPRISLLAAAIAGLLLGHPAVAQESTSPQSAALTLDEVVVTARKREENLQDVPIAVTAFSSEALEARGAHTVADLTASTPGFAVSGLTDGNFNPNFTVRGISSSARNIGFESTLGVYIDGVFVGRTSGFNQDLNDISHVEVLRGPQGTLFGKNTIAGAINIVTTTPSDALDLHGAIEVGENQLRRGDAHLSGPLVEGVLRGKVSVYSTRQDGYMTNLRSSGSGPATLGDQESRNVRGALDWTVNERLNLVLRTDFGKTTGTIYESKVIEGLGAIEDPYTLDLNRPSAEERRTGGASLTATLDLPAGPQLTSITAWRSLDYRIREMDLDSSPLDLLIASFDDRLDQYSQELRLSGDAGERWSYVGGIYLFRQDAHSNRAFALGADAGIPGGIRILSDVETKSAAAFGSVDYRLTDRFSLNAGLRYTREEKSLDYLQADGALLGYPEQALRDELSDDDLSYSASLNYKPGSRSLVYFRYANGFKSGGWNADLTGTGGAPFTAADLRFGSESIDSFELGYKADLLDRRLRLNTAVYYMDYSDIQISQFIGGLVGFKTTNAGKAHSQGVEVEITALPLEGLEISAGIGFNDSKYDDYANPDGNGGNLAGTRLPAPRTTASLGIEYWRRLGPGEWSVRTDYSHQSAVADDPLDPASAHEGYGLLNARIGYRWDNGLALHLWSKNLLDEKTRISRSTQGDLALFGMSQIDAVYTAPRTVGVRLSYAF